MLLQVVGGLGRVEHDRGVEEREEHDQRDIEHQEQRPAVAELRRQPLVSHSGPSPALKLATVVGSSSSDEAKIGGITPEVLSLSGRCEDCPSNIRLPTWRFGYWISRRRCGALHEHDEGDHDDRHHG